MKNAPLEYATPKPHQPVDSRRALHLLLAFVITPFGVAGLGLSVVIWAIATGAVGEGTPDPGRDIASALVCAAISIAALLASAWLVRTGLRKRPNE